MSDVTKAASVSPAPAATSDGELLSTIYGQLVPIHATLDEANALDAAAQRDIARDLMATLRLIEGSPEFQAACAAARARRTVTRSPRALAAEERIRQGREARRAQAGAQLCACIFQTKHEEQ